MLAEFKSNPELREEARASLRGNWGKAILTLIIYMVLTAFINGGTRFDDIGWLFSILVAILTGSWTAGILTYFVHLIRKQALSVKLLFSQLHRLIPFFILILLQAIFIILWTLLFIIPGFIAALRYSQALYIAIDNPEMKASAVINRRKEMMEGQKMKYFILMLSFIGWYLLRILTLGIGFLWLLPYVYATQAAFYENLRLQYEQKQSDLPR